MLKQKLEEIGQLGSQLAALSHQQRRHLMIDDCG
jgi:hypothetical protein